MSYANVAKGATSGTTSPDSVATDAPQQVNGNDLVENQLTAVDEGEPPVEPVPQPKKKVLAPAPVPEKSPWGATTAGGKDDSSNIDDSKWPTPDQVTVDAAKPLGPKFTKLTSLTKWVPIPAKVVLSQLGRSSQKASRPRKKTSKPKGKKDEAGANESSEETGDAADVESGDDSNGYKFNSSKPFRKFNGSSPPNGQSSYQKRYQNGGYYHPQPFYGQKPGFGGRQGGAGGSGRGGKHPNLRYYPNGSYRQQMGFMPMAPMAPMIPPALSPKQNPQEALIHQLDYYFSLENLIRDIYLRKNMDNDGWVLLSLILSFSRVKLIVSLLEELLEDTPTEEAILNAVGQCVNLETNGNQELSLVKLRVKQNWQQWVMPEDQR